jgi:hypothetical protein
MVKDKKLLQFLLVDVGMQIALYSNVHPPVSSWGRILGRNQDKNLFLVAIQSLVLRFLFFQAHATSNMFYSSITVHCKGERRKTFISFIWQSRPKRQYFTTFFNTSTWIKHNFIRKIQIDQENLIENVGAHYYACIMVVCTITTGSFYPLSEHVDILPVRLVSTFHRVFSVYLTLAIYLT